MMMDMSRILWEDPQVSVDLRSKNSSAATIKGNEFSSVNQAFVVALISAISNCTGPSDLSSTSALQNLKAIACTMHPLGNEYAHWLEERVRTFASENPMFHESYSVDVLRWTFSTSLFETYWKQVILAAPQALQDSSNELFPKAMGKGQKRIVPGQRVTSDPELTLKSRVISALFPPSIRHATDPLTSQPLAIAPNDFTARSLNLTRGQEVWTSSGSVSSKSESPSFSHSPNAPSSKAKTHGRTYFQPSRELLGIAHVPLSSHLVRANEVGIGRNPLYRGDLTDLDISNATCPPELNCAIRIENISCMATNTEIFAMFTEGKIFSFSKKDPIPGRFLNCAARLVFTTRAAAEAFITRGQSLAGIVLYGDRFRVKWNRDACRPVRDGERHQSRVIRVMGPEKELCAAGLEALFHTHIKFKLLDSKEWMVGNGKKVVELHFCSILGQSRIAYKFFHEYMEAWKLTGRFSIGFGPDPCDSSASTIKPCLTVSTGVRE